MLGLWRLLHSVAQTLVAAASFWVGAALIRAKLNRHV